MGQRRVSPHGISQVPYDAPSYGWFDSMSQGKRDSGWLRLKAARSSQPLRLTMGLIALAVLLIVPAQVLAYPGKGKPTTTTTTSTSTTTTPSSTTTTTLSTTTTTMPTSTTTTTTQPETTTSTNPPPDSTTTTTPPTSTTTTTADLEGEPEKDVTEELLPVPSITFPVVGRASYSDTFGAPRDGGAREHKGTDIFAEKGTPVVAVAHGVVVRMGDHPVSGQHVVVLHTDGWTSAYVHFDNDSPGTDNGLAMGFAPGIDIGTRVRPGTLLGFVGDSGNAEDSAPHLHFELHQPDGLKINPYEPLRQATPATEIHQVPTVELGQVSVTNASLTSHLDLGRGFNSELVVHRDHAFLGTWGNEERCPGTGVRAIDVTEPTNPTVVASFADHTLFPSTYISEIWVGEWIDQDAVTDVAVVGLGSCDETEGEEEEVAGIALFDVTDPAEPQLMSTIDVEATNGVSHLDVITSDGLTKIVASVPGAFQATGGRHGDVVIYDISDPVRPALVADWQPASESGLVPGLALEDDLSSLDPVRSVLWLEADTFVVGTGSDHVLVVSDDGDAPALTTPLPVSDGDSPTVPTSTVPVAHLGSQIVVTQASSDADGEIERRTRYLIDLEGTPAQLLTVSEVSVSERMMPADAVGAASHGSTSLIVSAPEVGVTIIDPLEADEPLAELATAPSIDPQWYWVDQDGAALPASVIWDVAKSDGHVFVSDHHSGLWVFTVAATDPVEIPGLTAN